MPKVAITDRGYRGATKVEDVDVLLPNPGSGKQSKYQKQKARKRFRGRAGIEPVIGHIKHDHRMIRNYLKGVKGDIINAISAAMGYNLKKRLNQIAFLILSYIKNIFNFIALSLIIKMTKSQKWAF